MAGKYFHLAGDKWDEICRSGHMDSKNFDVLIIGAGAAGLMAAKELVSTGKSVGILEARERTGGRIATIEDGTYPIELGAEFVHGNLSYTKKLLQKAGAQIYPVKGSIWQYKDGQLERQEEFISDFKKLEKEFGELKEDKSVAAFLEQNLSGPEQEELRFTVKNYVEGYYAADTQKASTKAFCEELTKGDEEQYHIEEGYGTLVKLVEKVCREKGVQFFLSQPVRQVQWKEGEVVVITEKGNFQGKKLLVTVPLGVLQNESITFFPALPQVKKAVQSLGFGHVVKIVFQFDDLFWQKKTDTQKKDLSGASFLFSEEPIPTWWTHYPKNKPTLTGWLGGPRAEAAQFLSKDEIVNKGLVSLSHILSIDLLHLQQKLVGAYYHNWSADPYSCGAYSYEVVDGNSAIKRLREPVEETLFFAGEGLHSGKEIGTVEAALISGRDTAHRIVLSFAK
jgi:monoamine oxidase